MYALLLILSVLNPISAYAQAFMRTPTPLYGCDVSRGGAICYLNQTQPRCPDNYGTPSRLFGCRGELWRANGRLQDYAYAGYWGGTRSIPNARNQCNVRTYGAQGNGRADDTAAIQRAITDCARHNNGSVVYFPAGTYQIRSQLMMTRSVVLRGAARNQTTLYFPRSLADINNNILSETQMSPYSYGNGVIRFAGWVDYTRWSLGAVTANAMRGGYRVQVSNATKFTAGQWILITQQNPSGGALIADLLRRCGTLGTFNSQRSENAVKHATRIRSVSIANRLLTLDRPLPWNISRSFSPRVFSFNNTINGAGVESLTILFPSNVKYSGHWRERGYNGISFSNVHNSWIRNVDIRNFDVGISMNCMFCTIDGVRLFSVSQRAITQRMMNVTGHNGIWLGSTDVLVQNVQVNTQLHHSISVSNVASGCVIKRAWSAQGVQLILDHHRAAPYATLWTDINVGRSTRWRESSGLESYGGANAAAFTTFWNIRSDIDIGLPGSTTGDQRSFGGWVNIVGMRTRANATDQQCNWYGENPNRLYPTDLHAAMRSSMSTRLRA